MTDIYCILGQTATGKTLRAAHFAREAHGSILSCDSQQLYKFVGIVTGGSDNPHNIPVYGVNIADPKEHYSSFRYVTYAREVIAQSLSQHKPLCIVGGSTMYSHHLVHGFTEIKSESEGEKFSDYSMVELQNYLREKFPTVYTSLNDSDRQNPRRLLRHLRITSATMEAGHALPPVSEICNLNVELIFHKSPDLARARIKARVEERLTQGALEEYKSLASRGYTLQDPGLKSAAYKHISDFLAGLISHSMLVDRWVTSEYQYAKRQKTYFRKYFPEATITEV